MKLKCKAMDFKTLCFLKILQSYPYPLSESSPGYTGKGQHANPRFEMREVYFYIVVMNFPFKAKQIMYEVWLACVSTYGEIDNPYRKVIQQLQSREVTENGL